MWARFACAEPPANENDPPMYQPPEPSGATASTSGGEPSADVGPETSGNGAAGWPSVPIGAPSPVRGPMNEKSPPMNVRPRTWATA